MRDLAQLERLLQEIDRKGYGAYSRIEGPWDGMGFTLLIDRVQRDPFATPSKVRIVIPEKVHLIPRMLWRTPPRRVAVENFILQTFAGTIRGEARVSGSGRSGDIKVDIGGPEILARSGCELSQGQLEIRFRVGLPAAGRSVLGRAAADLLCRVIPPAVETVLWDQLDERVTGAWADLAEDHQLLQEEPKARRLVAFVRDGSILPRVTGISQRPLPEAVPFKSPDSLRVNLLTLHHGEVRGMGIPEGFTLVTGGGFHGKTTLLEALQRGVYPHVPGAGREWVVSRLGSVKVRSEDGRAVTGVDIRPFVNDLPGGKSTEVFSTQDASGSTSLAAAILEAAEVGAEALFLDEDTCSTNLLVRDARMQELVKRETITPLVDRVRELYSLLEISTLLVVGGSGDYLDEADTVILMEDYLPSDATDDGRRVARSHPAGSSKVHRTYCASRPDSWEAGADQDTRSARACLWGRDDRLTALEQLVDDSQARTIGAMLKKFRTRAGPAISLNKLVRGLHEEVQRAGLFTLDSSPELAMPRPHEMAAAVNRLRSLKVETPLAERSA